LQEMLLWADDAAGTTCADPANGFGCGEAIVLHDVTGDQSARAAQACLAVDTDRA
jgi:hypothetical protein